MKYIYYIRHETDYGPFFSSRKKAIAYLQDDGEDGRWWAEHGKDVVNGDDAYTTIQKVKLDDINERYDG